MESPLDQDMVLLMQRVLSSGLERVPQTAAASRLVGNGIGTKKGKSVYFGGRDHTEMRRWLKNRGHTAEQTPDLSSLSRSQRLAFTPNEKSGGVTIKRNRVSVKALPNRPLLLCGEKVFLPENTHLDTDIDTLLDTLARHAEDAHDCLLIIENYESFNQIQGYRISDTSPYRNPLLVYRGDRYESRMDNVLRLINATSLPVIAFFDPDLAGMLNAARLPRFSGVLLPDSKILEAMLHARETRRSDLFDKQMVAFGRGLSDLAETHPCAKAWALFKTARACLVQERLCADSVQIVIWQAAEAGV